VKRINIYNFEKIQDWSLVEHLYKKYNEEDKFAMISCTKGEDTVLASIRKTKTGTLIIDFKEENSERKTTEGSLDLSDEVDAASK